jgi:TonB family protein
MMLGSLLFASLLAVSAQEAPDAARLLSQRHKALEMAHSYEYTEEMSADMIPATINLVQGIQPGKMRMESKMGEMAILTLVSDGVNTWMYSPMMKQYTKMPATTEKAKALTRDAMGGEVAEDESTLQKNAHVVRSETLDVGGQTHDCWVIESHLPKKDKPDSVFTFWIDKGLGLQLQMTVSGMQMKMVMRSLKFGADLPNSLFVFTPPAGAKETAELFPGMPGSEPASGDGPPKAAASPAGAPSGNEPQAYVPHMHPIARVNPEFPEAARSKGLGGTVHLLLTIDATGRVIDAEPLTGRAILRPAAVDAVKKWKFQPVLRDHNPVNAYTDAAVFFFDPAKPAKDPADLGTDMAEEMAAARRIVDLQQKFPRSPAQVLSDLEEHSEGLDAMTRASALPEVAKAALDAGDLDKATKYANELLQSAADPHDWNYGNAIHDGNMVLGMVALRQNDLEQAKHYLIESGKTPGSPQLDSFGPDLRLARELAKKGERNTVTF